MSNLLDLLCRRRGLFGSAAVPIVVVGACAFPDYTFEQQAQAVGGVLGGTTTGDIGVSTGFGGITSIGGASTAGASIGSTSSSATTGTINSGGSAGSDFGGAAGETGDGGSGAVGAVTTSGDAGSVGGIGGGLGGTGDGGSGGGGSGGSGTGGSAGNGPCGNDAQCASHQCDGGSCRLEHCGNGEPDVNETDTDCGGADCRPCGYEQHCVNDSDCATADCSEIETCRPKLVISCFCSWSGNCDLTPVQTTVDLTFENTGSEPIDLEGLRFHYYYSAEGTGTDEVMCDSVNFTGATCERFDHDELETEYDDATASDEVVFWFTGVELAAGATTGSIRFSINNNGPYQRSNDYSFPDELSDVAETVCDRIVAMNADDVPVWGLLPE